MTKIADLFEESFNLLVQKNDAFALSNFLEGVFLSPSSKSEDRSFFHSRPLPSFKEDEAPYSILTLFHGEHLLGKDNRKKKMEEAGVEQELISSLDFDKGKGEDTIAELSDAYVLFKKDDDLFYCFHPSFNNLFIKVGDIEIIFTRFLKKIKKKKENEVTLPSMPVF